MGCRDGEMIYRWVSIQDADSGAYSLCCIEWCRQGSNHDRLQIMTTDRSIDHNSLDGFNHEG